MVSPGAVHPRPSLVTILHGTDSWIIFAKTSSVLLSKNVGAQFVEVMVLDRRRLRGLDEHADDDDGDIL